MPGMASIHPSKSVSCQVSTTARVSVFDGLEQTHRVETDQFTESLDESTLVGLGQQAVVVHPGLLPHAYLRGTGIVSNIYLSSILSTDLKVWSKGPSIVASRAYGCVTL